VSVLPPLLRNLIPYYMHHNAMLYSLSNKNLSESLAPKLPERVAEPAVLSNGNLIHV